MERFDSTSSIRLALIHVLAWLCYVGAIYVINIINHTPLSLDQALLITLLLGLVFYPVLWILYRFFPRKRYITGVSSLIAYFLFVLPAFYYLAVYQWYPKVGATLPLEHAVFSLSEFFKNYGVGVFRFTAYALVYYNVDRKIKEGRARNRAEVEKVGAETKALKAENEKLAFEMAALSVQISPHLLNSVLNKLYGSAVAKHPDHPDRLLLLAEVASYATEATRPEDALVTVAEELEVIRKMESLTDISVEYGDDFTPATRRVPTRFRIPRLSLVSLFENALKYSPRTENSQPILVCLEVSQHELRFICANQKGTARRHDESMGTGLANLRRRLQIQYGGAATLTTSETPGAFEARITIALPVKETEHIPLQTLIKSP